LDTRRTRWHLRNIHAPFDQSVVSATVRHPSLYLLDLKFNVWISALYAHKFHTGFWHNVSDPESFGFASTFVHSQSCVIIGYEGELC